MTSDDRWTDMADIDAELERLLGGGSPPAEAPAWFGDVAVLVRTARAAARPDELAGEADIVARMVEVRLAVLAEAEAEGEAEADRPEADAGAAPAITRVNGVNGHAHSNGTSLGRDEHTHNGTSLGRDEHTHNGTNVGGDEDGRNRSSLGAYAAADDESDHGSLEDRLRERMAVSDLDEYRAKHGGERHYVAKHTAPPPEEPPRPVARTVGRVIAMKAVAVTTAAIIGVAAAAAATTGIVANVVVPAFNEHYRRPAVVTSESPELKDEDEPGTSRSTRNPTTPGQIWACESTVLTPCVPPPLVSVTDPATGVPLVATTTTVPTTTSTSVPDDATTSTTTSDTTGTTEPDPTTSTPTSVTVASEPPSP